MKATLINLLTEIQTLHVQFNQPATPPAAANELHALQQQALDQLKYELPISYLELLTHSNGLDWNGTQLYGTHDLTRLGATGRTSYDRMGLVEANLLWREYEPNTRYIFFAESGDVLYCHNLTNDKFEIVDRITTELIYEPSSFNSCEELLQTLLNHMLNRYEVKGAENGG